MLRRILILEEGRVPAKNARGWKMEGKKKSPGRSAKDFKRNLGWEVSWLKKGLWHIAKKRMLEDRGAYPEEEGDLIR